MKTIVFFMCILLSPAIWGQKVDHFSNMDSRWYVAKTYPHTDSLHTGFIETTTTLYGFNGDTIINGEKWLKMVSTPDSTFSGNQVFKGLIRSSNNLVLKWDGISQPDTLYNFNLAVGDSIFFDLGPGAQYIPVINIDSILINGQYYRRITFAEPTGPNFFTVFHEAWIEGIGSVHGPLFPGQPVVFSTEMPDSMMLVCSHSNGQQIWQHPSYPNCVVNVILRVEANQENNIVVYPNPCVDKIRVKSTGHQSFSIEIFNSQGQLIRSVSLTSESEAVDLSGLLRGVYFVKILSGQSIRIEKVIKL